MATLRHVAAAIGCHERTLARALAGRVDAQFFQGMMASSPVDLERIARKLRCKPEVLRRVLRGRDSFIRQETAARMVGYSVRQFRKRRDVPPAVRARGILRFSAAALIAISGKGRS